MSALTTLKPLLQATPGLAGLIAWDAWVTDQDERGEKVALYRDYADGEHPGKLTKEMRAALRLGDSAGDSAPFALNYMDDVVTTMSDRLELTGMRADNDGATAWAGEVLDEQRLDGFQIGVHDAALRDGDTYVMVAWDNERQALTFSHEEAYDGVEGVLVIYPNKRARTPSLAIKIWAVEAEGDTLANKYRINLYYPDRVEKYVTLDSRLERHEVEGEPWPAPWTQRNGEPIGVPVVHFSNRGVRYTQFGRSEMDDAIPAQNALNRTLMSFVMASELTAFQIKVAKGFEPPAGVTPGMWIEILMKDALGNLKTDLDEPTARWLQQASVDVLPQGELTPYLDGMRFLIEQIHAITKTPHQGTVSDDASGESRKQAEVGLLGKCRRAQTTFGNAWENVMLLAHAVQRAYGGDAPPDVRRFTAEWKSAELRDQAAHIKSVKEIQDWLPLEERLALVAWVFDWDAAKVTRIAREMEAQETRAAMQAMGALPGFGGGVSLDRLLGGNGGNGNLVRSE